MKTISISTTDRSWISDCYVLRDILKDILDKKYKCKTEYSHMRSSGTEDGTINLTIIFKANVGENI